MHFEDLLPGCNWGAGEAFPCSAFERRLTSVCPALLPCPSVPAFAAQAVARIIGCQGLARETRRDRSVSDSSPLNG